MSAALFDDVVAQATERLSGDDLYSVYVGLITAEADQEYFFANDTSSAEELRDAAVDQLAMLTRVLATQSDSTIEEVANLAAERAEELQLF
jgi:hypothetical protein